MHKKFKTIALALVLSFTLSTNKAHAYWGDGGAGWANFPYLVKILLENFKRYQQIKQMIDQAKNRKRFLEALNAGINNSIGLLNTLPIKDEGLLNDLKTFQKSFKTVTTLYGEIPKSKEAALQMLHDQTVAESLRMVVDFKGYAKKQEENANILKYQGRSASPKGAQRMTVESNAMILKSMSQMMRLETQNLKLQSELLAMKNRSQKKSVFSHNKINQDLGSAFKNFKTKKGFIHF